MNFIYDIFLTDYYFLHVPYQQLSATTNFLTAKITSTNRTILVKQMISSNTNVKRAVAYVEVRKKKTSAEINHLPLSFRPDFFFITIYPTPFIRLIENKNCTHITREAGSLSFTTASQL